MLSLEMSYIKEYVIFDQKRPVQINLYQRRPCTYKGHIVHRICLKQNLKIRMMYIQIHQTSSISHIDNVVSGLSIAINLKVLMIIKSVVGHF